MSKLIEKDGKFYRLRRGKLVEIPKEWVGKVTFPQTIRKRESKQREVYGFVRNTMRWSENYFKEKFRK